MFFTPASTIKNLLLRRCAPVSWPRQPDFLSPLQQAASSRGSLQMAKPYAPCATWESHTATPATGNRCAANRAPRRTPYRSTLRGRVPCVHFAARHEWVQIARGQCRLLGSHGARKASVTACYQYLIGKRFEQVPEIGRLVNLPRRRRQVERAQPLRLSNAYRMIAPKVAVPMPPRANSPNFSVKSPVPRIR